MKKWIRNLLPVSNDEANQRWKAKEAYLRNMNDLQVIMYGLACLLPDTLDGVGQTREELFRRASLHAQNQVHHPPRS